MLETLVSSKTRLKILLKFFLNENAQAHLRGLEEEFSESTNSIRIELNRFEAAGFLISNRSGNKKIFSANILHPLFKDIQSILKKMTGIDYVIDYTLKQIGDLKKVYLVGSLANGIDSKEIELILVGDINTNYLNKLVPKAEKKINKKIIFKIFTKKDFDLDKIDTGKTPPLLIWSK